MPAAKRVHLVIELKEGEPITYGQVARFIAALFGGAVRERAPLAGDGSLHGATPERRVRWWVD